MKSGVIGLILVLAIPPVLSTTAHALACAAGSHAAGCVGHNGAVVARSGGVHKGAAMVGPKGVHTAAPAVITATKALEPGCAFVNGKRICHRHV